MIEIAFRFVLAFFAGVIAYYFVYWIPFAFFPIFNNDFIPKMISLVCASGTGWLVWYGMGTNGKGALSHAALGAALLGTFSFLLGFVGPMILFPNANQGPLLGFFTGPLGFFLGGAIGFAVFIVKRIFQWRDHELAP